MCATIPQRGDNLLDVSCTCECTLTRRRGSIEHVLWYLVLCGGRWCSVFCVWCTVNATYYQCHPWLVFTNAWRWQCGNTVSESRPGLESDDDGEFVSLHSTNSILHSRMVFCNLCRFLSMRKAYLGNGTGCRTAAMGASLFLTSGLVRCEAVLHDCGTSPVCLFVLQHSNSISVISWQWYDVWDEKEKAWAYSFTDSREL